MSADRATPVCDADTFGITHGLPSFQACERRVLTRFPEARLYRRQPQHALWIVGMRYVAEAWPVKLGGQWVLMLAGEQAK